MTFVFDLGFMSKKINEDTDHLFELNTGKTLKKKLTSIHRSTKEEAGFIDRIGVALYDGKTGTLKTFIDSGGTISPLVHYDYKLEKSPSLKKIFLSGKPRILDLTSFDAATRHHSKMIWEHGFRSSFTFPMYHSHEFLGFIFFDSFQSNPFFMCSQVLLRMVSQLIKSNIIIELTTIKTMLASLKTATNIVHFKDPETASHLERMSRFSRLIAQKISKAGHYKLDDEYIEHVFMFAPLHDVGKIGIPDKILLKPGRLTDQEYTIMKTHAEKGKNIVENIIANFHFGKFENINILRNIVSQHHETLDGRGYPNGIVGEKISLESKIVAISDIFDALTSERPYKQCWSNEDALAELYRMADIKLDKVCIKALDKNMGKVLEIQKLFNE